MEEKEELASLKETLYHQHLLMQKLHAELEEERESSATAATEALSMILRLQGEKAAEKMESCQYKRMTEARMHHAEETLVIFEELLYQKEMEIASLKFQVQDYVDYLSGIVSEGNTSDQSSEGPSFLLREKSFKGHVRRNSSLPVLKIKELRSQIDGIDKEISSARSIYLTPRYTDESKDKLNQVVASETITGSKRSLTMISERSALGSCSFCFEQVEEKEEKAVELTQAKIVEEDVVPECAFVKDTPMPFENGRNPPICNIPCNSDNEESRTKHNSGDGSSFSNERVPHDLTSDASGCGSYLKTISSTKTAPSMKNIHDIFEVPQCNSATGEHRNLASLKSDSWDKCLKQGVLNTCMGSRLCTPRKLEQFEKRIQKLEEDGITLYHEKIEREEQMKLLRDIHDKLKIVQSYMCEPKTKKARPQDKYMYEALVEAMMSFSI